MDNDDNDDLTCIIVRHLDIGLVGASERSQLLQLRKSIENRRTFRVRREAL